MNLIMKRALELAGLALAAGWPPAAHAQNILSLDQAVAFALGDQPTVQAYRREADASEQAAETAAEGFAPYVD